MNRNRYFILVSIIILIILSFLSLCVGRYPVSPLQLMTYFFTVQPHDPNFPVILYQIRLPRIIGAIAAGGALSISGAAYQGMFRNPMVSSGILGVTSGAGFGASVAILLSLPIVGIQFLSFAGGISAVLIAVMISRWVGKKHDQVLVLVLSGIIISSLFNALLSMLKYVADPDDKLPEIIYWLMGSISGIKMTDLALIIPIILAGSIPLWLISWRLDVMSFGEEEARSMGINASRIRTLAIFCASLVTACVISVSGIIGWVGLIIPHLARLIVGPGHKMLLPSAFLLGAIFMLVIDNLARSLAPVEIPLGILTSIIGAPVFIYFLKKKSTQRSW